MNISKIQFTAILLSTVLCTTCGTAIAINNHWFDHHDLQVHTNVYVFDETVGGTNELAVGNVITHIGDLRVSTYLGNGTSTANATKWISLSNDASPLSTWTKLPNEVAANGFTRGLGTVVSWFNGTYPAFNVTLKFYSATADQALQCAGLQWSGVSASDNNLFACAAFTATTFHYASHDNCTIRWCVTTAG